MDDSNFKSSEELGLTDDVHFMTRFSNNLQMQPFPVYKKNRFASFVTAFGVSIVGAVLVWLVWPTITASSESWIHVVESNVGLPLSFILGLIGLGIFLLVEFASGQVDGIL